MAPLIELQNVSKAYGPIRAVLGVSCRFLQGEVVVIRGANGSGKSTLLAVIGTLIRPSSGNIDYGELGRGRPTLRRTLGWVGHESLCYPDLTGRQNVELAARLHGCDSTEAFARAADRFELGPFADRAVRTYSRGQRQRIAIARALVHKPRLLLLDEPTTGLDAATTTRLAGVLQEEAARGAFVVLVTHDMAFAEAVGVRVLGLSRGRLVNPSD
ncbi:MAG: ABC transporter ATP-binding protein [Myxococcota bacterium]|nr:ABC transporter ATP-binding protein [Myxococcota bacterium]